ncbi:MAG: GNAT family protein [Actinomycetota bacterium]
MEYLRGSEIEIRPMSNHDIGLLLLWINDDSVSPFWYGSHRRIEREELLRDWADYFDESEPDKGRCFIIEDRSGPVGTISYTNDSHDLDGRKDLASLDILIAGEENQNRGLGTAALKLMTTALLEGMGFESVIASTYSFNGRMRHCLEKLGFIEEGFICGIDRTNGEYLESVVYSLSNNEPRFSSISSQ